MKLSDLNLDVCGLWADSEITDITFRVQEVKQGSLFFCLRGKERDGHEFAAEAERKGAAAIVCEREADVKIPQIIVPDSRKALSIASAAFYLSPASKLKIIGITGTNGKTTTSYIVKSIFEAAGYKTGLIGTNCIMAGDKTYPAVLTTPDPIDLHRIFREMADCGLEYVVIEVSAHAIALNKLDGLQFEATAFTNLSQDHLDYFKDIRVYGEVKKSLFTTKHTRRSIINVDDKLGREIVLETDTPVLTYGCENPADIFAIDLVMSADGIEYVLNANDDIADVKFSLPGRFNMYNTLCAAAIAKSLGLPLKAIVEGIRSLKKIEGRFNVVSTSKCTVIIDFAHTDDGLKNILKTIEEFALKRIITVFGCGGDRDKKKRPIMGEIVSLYSDYCVVTSDNPRSENPSKIMDDITAGMGSNNYICIEDRKEAIKYALEFAGQGDIVLIAGKGAEKYQEIGGVKHAYNDEEYVLKLLEEGKI